jgi:hypothetical protein
MKVFRLILLMILYPADAGSSTLRGCICRFVVGTPGRDHGGSRHRRYGSASLTNALRSDATAPNQSASSRMMAVLHASSDTCLGTVCAAGKTCQIDSNGNARCIPQAGTATTDTSSGCKNGGRDAFLSTPQLDPVPCARSTPDKNKLHCRQNEEKGSPRRNCLRQSRRSHNFSSSADLVGLSATYVNNDLASCEKRNNIAPLADGAKDATSLKPCFFGIKNALAAGLLTHTARCRCVRW